MVVDADGLRLMKKIDGWDKLLPPRTILTPHPGEMADLTGKSVEDIQADRLNTARAFAKAWGHIVVLKGAFTVIAEPQGRATVISNRHFVAGQGWHGRCTCWESLWVY